MSLLDTSGSWWCFTVLNVFDLSCKLMMNGRIGSRICFTTRFKVCNTVLYPYLREIARKLLPAGEERNRHL